MKPSDVTPGSGKKVWWLCEQGHEWMATIVNRSNGYGCPYCSGRMPISGVSDLSTVNPTLAAEWHPIKNGSLKPTEVLPGSDKKVWWLCKQGHEWQARIADRSNGSCCPYCHVSKGERLIRDILNNKHIDFIRENTFPGRSRLRDDFALLSSDGKVIETIEYNGEQHYEPVDFSGKGPAYAERSYQNTVKRDQKKREWLIQHGIPQLVVPYWDYDKIPDIVDGFLKHLKLIA